MVKTNRFGDFGGYVKNVSWLKQTDLVISVVMTKTDLVSWLKRIVVKTDLVISVVMSKTYRG